MSPAPLNPCAFLNTGCHSLKGNLKGYWSVTVRANLRIIFRFEHGDVHDVE